MAICVGRVPVFNKHAWWFDGYISCNMQSLWRRALLNFLDPLGISLCTLCSKDWTDKTIPSLSPVAPNQCFIKGWGVVGGGEEVALGIPPLSPVFQGKVIWGF